MKMYEKTDNGILYDSWVEGPDGVRIELFPQKDKHTSEDVKVAKHQLRNSQDVLGFKITWEDIAFYKENDY
jgi:hypothetical protein